MDNQGNSLTSDVLDYIYKHIHAFIYTCTCVHTDILICIYMHTNIHTCACVYVYMCICTDIYAYAHPYILVNPHTSSTLILFSHFPDKDTEV